MSYEILARVREKKPLIHHITNWVSIYECANITRAFGALPVMAHAREESPDMVSIASALVLNIGTLTMDLIESMITAGKQANKLSIPVVLDAVGVGATKLRDEKAFEILDNVDVTIIKGNASEIARLAGEQVVTKGVEATQIEADIESLAGDLARQRSATVVVTGREDVVTDGERVYVVKNGHEMMGAVVGTGCMAASVIGAFTAVENDYAFAAASALACYGIAGERAAAFSRGPGSFKMNLYDEVYNLDRENIERMINIEKRQVEKD